MWHRIKTFFTRVVQQILMRHSEQRERARALLEQVKRDGSTPTSPNKVSDVVDRDLFVIGRFRRRKRDRTSFASARDGYWLKLDVVQVPPPKLYESVRTRSKPTRKQRSDCPSWARKSDSWSGKVAILRRTATFTRNWLPRNSTVTQTNSRSTRKNSVQTPQTG